MAWIQLAQGRTDEAAQSTECMVDADFRDLLRVYVRWNQGQREESSRLLAELTGNLANVFAYQFAQAHAHRGEVDAAFDWLERTYDQHDPGLHHAYSDPVLAPLRADPRWLPLMKKVGFLPA
jgi:serine/threonine-protein kinase